MTGLFTDTTTSAIERALTGVAERQRVTTHNIANVTTPGFRASRVEFEEQLGKALERGQPVGSAEIHRTRANTPINTQGNDVSLELESKDLIESGIHYEALVNALNHKLGALRSAIRGA